MNDIVSLTQIEAELQKRLSYPYEWGVFQNNKDDAKSNFIYSILYFEDLLQEINRLFKDSSEYKKYFNYVLNRWYNFWSAQAIEKIFCMFPQVTPSMNSQDQLVDFKIKGLQFDHKNSVFPKKYPKSLTYAKKYPEHLLYWLYNHQSQEKRKHLQNRIFILFHAQDGEHWKLKAQISLLKDIIQNYLQTFSFYQLSRLELQPSSLTLTDIIWFTN